MAVFLEINEHRLISVLDKIPEESMKQIISKIHPSRLFEGVAVPHSYRDLYMKSLFDRCQQLVCISMYDLDIDIQSYSVDVSKMSKVQTILFLLSVEYNYSIIGCLFKEVFELDVLITDFPAIFNQEVFDFGMSLNVWPKKVSNLIVAESLKKYYEASQYKPSPVCAICCRSHFELEYLECSSNDKAFEQIDLSFLDIKDQFILERCLKMQHSEEFLYKNANLNGRMIDKRGVICDSEEEAIVRFCSDCFHALSLPSASMPKFALTNNLYRGRLLGWITPALSTLLRAYPR